MYSYLSGEYIFLYYIIFFVLYYNMLSGVNLHLNCISILLCYTELYYTVLHQLLTYLPCCVMLFLTYF